MRRFASILTLTALASCTTAPPPPARTAENQLKYDRLMEGKVAGQPLSCVPTYAANDMQVIDDNTLVFRQTPNKIYVMQTNGCSGLTSGFNTLVTKQHGGMGLCQGDIATVVNHDGMTVGSCALGQVVPYERS